MLGMDPAFPDMSAALAGLEVSLLIAASTPEPPSVERVLALADQAPEEEKRSAEIISRLALGRLERLAELGLLTIDTHFRVPPALIGCVLDAFDDDVIDRLHLGEAVDDAKAFCRVTGPAAEDPTQKCQTAYLATRPGPGRHAAGPIARRHSGRVRVVGLPPAQLPDRWIPRPQLRAGGSGWPGPSAASKTSRPRTVRAGAGIG